MSEQVGVDDIYRYFKFNIYKKYRTETTYTHSHTHTNSSIKNKIYSQSNFVKFQVTNNRYIHTLIKNYNKLKIQEAKIINFIFILFSSSLYYCCYYRFRSFN
jgi:hypothetical protein